MNQIEEQKDLIKFLESALQEAGSNSNTSPEKLGMIQRKLEEARQNLSNLNPGAAQVGTASEFLRSSSASVRIRA